MAPACHGRGAHVKGGGLVLGPRRAAWSPRAIDVRRARQGMPPFAVSRGGRETDQVRCTGEQSFPGAVVSIHLFSTHGNDE